MFEQQILCLSSVETLSSSGTQSIRWIVIDLFDIAFVIAETESLSEALHKWKGIECIESKIKGSFTLVRTS